MSYLITWSDKIININSPYRKVLKFVRFKLPMISNIRYLQFKSIFACCHSMVIGAGAPLQALIKLLLVEFESSC